MPGEPGETGFGGKPGDYVRGDYVSLHAARAEAAAPSGPTPGARAALVKALARAVQAFHTYPPGSPARRDVADAVRERAQGCLSPGDLQVEIDVTGEGLRVAGEFIHADRGPERALAITLRKAYVATVEIHAGVPSRDIQQFCSLVAFPERLLRREAELPEVLADRGVQHIVVQTIPSHQTVEAGTVPEPMLDMIRRRRELESSRPNANTPEGGWLRLDPSVTLDRVTLDDLPLLMRDPPSLGIALHQVSGHDRDDLSPHQAMVAHYEEISELYARCDPAVGGGLFQRLADAVRALPEEMKSHVLKEQVLPDLLDGRRGGSVLGHFTDEEIADALWLLLDLGVGGVEMLSAGLAKLELPESRLPCVVDQVSRRFREAHTGGGAANIAWLDGLAADGQGIGGRLGIEGGRASDFLAFRSLDLTVDDAAAAELDRVVREVRETDAVTATLRCCADLLGQSANPPVVAAAMRATRGLFFTLESRGDVAVLASWLARYASIAQAREEHDAEVSAIIRDALDQYVTPEFINRVSALAPEAAGEPLLVTIICALGGTGVAALIESLAVEADRSARSRLMTALQPRSPDLAEHLVDYLSHPKWYVVRNVLTLLGHAGPGREGSVLELVDHEDPRVVREAFLALARIGTPTAAEHTRDALRHPSPVVRRCAGETVWRYESDVSHRLALDALGDPELAALDPAVLLALLEDAHKRKVEGIAEHARRLRRHVLAFWNADRRALGFRAIRAARAES